MCEDIDYGNSLKEAYTPINRVEIIHRGVLEHGAADVAIISGQKYEQSAAPRGTLIGAARFPLGEPE